MNQRFLLSALSVLAVGALFFGWTRPPELTEANAARLARLNGPDYDRLVTKPLTAAGDLTELEKIHRAVIRANPALTEAKVALGELLRETGRAKGALEWHRTAREDHPENPFIVWSMLRDLEVLGELREALHGADILLKEPALPGELRTELEAFLRRVGDEPRLRKLASVK